MTLASRDSGSEPLLEFPQLLEERAELGSRGAIVTDPSQRRQLLGASGSALRRHLRLLVPDEQARGALEVRDLAQAPQELVEAGGEVRHEAGA